MTTKIMLVHRPDDWEALYINGVIATEGHKIEAFDLYAILKLRLDPSTPMRELVMDEWWTDPQWDAMTEHMPYYFEDVKVRF